MADERGAIHQDLGDEAEPDQHTDEHAERGQQRIRRRTSQQAASQQLKYGNHQAADQTDEYGKTLVAPDAGHETEHQRHKQNIEHQTDEKAGKIKQHRIRKRGVGFRQHGEIVKQIDDAAYNAARNYAGDTGDDEHQRHQNEGNGIEESYLDRVEERLGAIHHRPGGVAPRIKTAQHLPYEDAERQHTGPGHGRRDSIHHRIGDAQPRNSAFKSGDEPIEQRGVLGEEQRDDGEYRPDAGEEREQQVVGHAVGQCSAVALGETIDDASGKRIVPEHEHVVD